MIHLQYGGVIMILVFQKMIRGYDEKKYIYSFSNRVICMFSKVQSI
jgi:hypothetical protein